MIGILDAELFPDDCEVIEIPPHNQYVYLIQKNGSSSLRLEHEAHGYNIYRNDQVRDIPFIDVYIRNPRVRYVSGVNTYLQHLQRDYPALDYDTAFWFIKKYKFLNRHYLPQLYWVYNLSRFLSPTAKMRIRDFQTFGNITDINYDARVKPAPRDFVSQLLKDDEEMNLWWYVDQILLDLAGQEMSWQDIVKHYKTHHPDLAKNVLPKT